MRDVIWMQNATHIVGMAGDRALRVTEHRIPLAREFDAIRLGVPIEQSLTAVLERDLQHTLVGLERGDLGVGAEQTFAVAVSIALRRAATDQKIAIAAVLASQPQLDFDGIALATQMAQDFVVQRALIVGVSVGQQLCAGHG